MESINPYAPTTSTAQVLIDQRLPKSKVTTMAIASRTITGISLSGGLFGVGLVLAMFMSWGFEPGLLLYAGIAFGFGLVIAGIAGSVTVAILLGIFNLSQIASDADAPAGSRWTIRRLVCFALLSGAISGFTSLAIPTRGAPEALIWAIVPAVVGAIGAYVMNRPCFKTLRQERLERIAKESQQLDPLALESPPI
ncbi:hypothetical protein LF1_32190 [Rubripirellula obstinata]|uniref:Uncharacterized protein n=1 Tax=Rubripirellula obstinata TaxID=406547 RepID=A0A5B1CLM1_9BACT|nr:hypothetical protein [Rubripirellula obstinata]KAA1260679.1 hypothetical protein LF1_32190 [Rubripirellula obstinata]